jgi:hypothetical protein
MSRLTASPRGTHVRCCGHPANQHRGCDYGGGSVRRVRRARGPTPRPGVQRTGMGRGCQRQQTGCVAPAPRARTIPWRSGLGARNKTGTRMGPVQGGKPKWACGSERLIRANRPRFQRVRPSFVRTKCLYVNGLAEGEGFEPPARLPGLRFSRPPPSTARPSLRTSGIGIQGIPRSFPDS